MSTKRLKLILRRFLFLVLVVPVNLLLCLVIITTCIAEAIWVIMGFISGQTEHKWLNWTDLLVDSMYRLCDKVANLTRP